MLEKLLCVVCCRWFQCVEDGLVLPMFKNLVSLSFGSNHKRCWKLLPYLLKQSPKVETIVIKVYFQQAKISIYICIKKRYFKSLHASSFWCFSRVVMVTHAMIPLQVKVLDILVYKGTAKEFEHLKSLLGATKCNEKVRVEFHENVWWMWMMTLLLKPVGI